MTPISNRGSPASSLLVALQCSPMGPFTKEQSESLGAISSIWFENGQPIEMRSFGLHLQKCSCVGIKRIVAPEHMCKRPYYEFDYSLSRDSQQCDLHPGSKLPGYDLYSGANTTVDIREQEVVLNYSPGRRICGPVNYPSSGLTDGALAKNFSSGCLKCIGKCPTYDCSHSIGNLQQRQRRGEDVHVECCDLTGHSDDLQLSLRTEQFVYGQYACGCRFKIGLSLPFCLWWPFVPERLFVLRTRRSNGMTPGGRLNCDEGGEVLSSQDCERIHIDASKRSLDSCGSSSLDPANKRSRREEVRTPPS